jgi:ribosomal protein S18 acetylase RimI-like enzyme
MDIRAATAADTDPVVTLWGAAGLTRPWNDPVLDLERALTGPSSTVLVGVDDTGIRATAMVGHDGHRGWVYYVAVREGARGQGNGAAIMHAAEEWLRARGVPKVQLMVRDTNASAIGFYEALGYEASDVRVLARRL